MKAYTEHTVPGLSDDGWAAIRDLFDLSRRRRRGLRSIVDAVLYVLLSESLWRDLPAGYAPWQTAYGYYRGWLKSGLWARVMDRLTDDEIAELTRASREYRETGTQHPRTAPRSAGVAEKLLAGEPRRIVIAELYAFYRERQLDPAFYLARKAAA